MKVSVLRSERASRIYYFPNFRISENSDGETGETERRDSFKSFIFANFLFALSSVRGTGFFSVFA